MKPKAIIALPKTAGKLMLTCPLAVALRFMKISGAEEPKAKSVAPAMSSLKLKTSQIMSMAGQRKSSHMMARERNTAKAEAVRLKYGRKTSKSGWLVVILVASASSVSSSE